jgi:hypothetical protein
LTSYLVSLDPGIRVSGLAVFRDSVLIHARILKNPTKEARGPTAWWTMAGEAVNAFRNATAWFPGVAPVVFVTEVPQVYRFGNRKVDPDDLIQLAGVGGAVGASLKPAAAHGYYPRQWKGSVDKDVMVRRILGRLSRAERAAIAPCTASLKHNVVDAIGIGLHHLGRLHEAGRA